jgi:uncharacterized membrane protein YbhN (UPF0104 family)
MPSRPDPSAGRSPRSAVVGTGPSPVWPLALAYAVANIASAFPIMPGGLGASQAMRRR